MESQQSGVEEQNPLHQPAGHDSLDAAQVTVGLPVSEHTLVGHPELLVYQQAQVLLLRAVLN